MNGLDTLNTMLHVGAAALLGLPVGWHRERHTRLAGLRTFPLVSMGACAYVLISIRIFGYAAEHPDASARILQGLITGIGFIGGGAIVKNRTAVVGTASAASIWITGAVGAAVAFGYWSLAIGLSLMNFLVILVLGFIKQRVPTEDIEGEDCLQEDDG